MNTKHEIALLQIKFKEEELNRDISQSEMNSIKKKILELEYPFMEWDDLKRWIIENRNGGREYMNNPIVRSSNGYKMAQCFINKDGKMEIGGYRHDHFPRNKKLRVHFEFKDWSTCYG